MLDIALHPAVECPQMTRNAALTAIKEQTDTVLLSFSRGKDSLAAWCYLRDAGLRVVPFHMELIPGLGFVEKSLRYYEDFFGVHIYRVIHPNLYHWIRTAAFQPASRLGVIDRLGLPQFDYADVNRGVARTAGLPEDTWCAVGTRSVDSPIRRMSIARTGPLNEKRRTFMPIFDMRKAELIGLLSKHGVKLPEDYAIWGRSFDGIDYRFLSPMRRHYPDDFQKICDWFPWAKTELARREIAERMAS